MPSLKQISKQQTIAFLALPFIAFALMIASSAIDAMGPHFTLPVQGYDPRSLLYGNYMNLRVHQSVLDGLKDCGCIDSASTITYMGCKEVESKNCVAVLNGMNANLLKSLHAPIQLYIDEVTAPTIEAAVRNDPKRLRLDATMKDGSIVVHGLLLDGQPVKMMPSNPFDKLVK